MTRLIAPLCMAMLLTIPSAFGQAPTLTLNGSANGASVMAGDLITIMVTVAPGSSVDNEVWVDINSNGRVDPGTDRRIFMFPMQDGGPAMDGPGDDDGMANGVITSTFPAGLAPARWVFVTSNVSGSDTSWFEITPLAVAAATINGTVSAPVGVDKSYLVIEAEPTGSGHGPDIFWHALTDASGNYSLRMGGDPVSMNPWRVGISSESITGRLVTLRRDTLVNVSGTPAVVNFQLIQGTVLTGRVVDQSAAPVEWAYPHTHDVANPQGSGGFGNDTDSDGYYAIVVPPGNYFVHFTKDGYKDQWYNGKTSSQTADQISVVSQDTIPNINGTLQRAGLIRGRVTNYGMPVRATVRLYDNSMFEINWRETNNDGSYGLTVDPGTYTVKFEFGGSSLWYDQRTSPPGDSITITGTETVDMVDAYFMVGPPPLPDPPRITRVWDVPFDNGRQVYIRFTGIDRDFATSEGTNGFYGVDGYSIERRDGQYWVYLKSVPASAESSYTTIVPSLKDSTKTEGMFWSRYRVKAHGLFNLFVLTSMPDSGYSLDNMAPGVPAGLGSTVAGPDVVLRWDPAEEEDFRYYSVYRGTTPDFAVTGLTPYARVATNSYIDAGASSGTFYYRITATDHAGNESTPSLPVPSSGTTSVTGSSALPSSFALHRNYPNPFNPSTRIAFDVPATARVRITVFNMLGEPVATLVDAVQPAGTHTATFRAVGLPSGMYIVRMISGEFSTSRRISLLK